MLDLYEIQRDVLRLKNQYQEFQQIDRLLKANYKKLAPYYEEYIDEVSMDWMAVSLELSAFLLTFCQITQPKQIADLGSGFSSFVLRLYAAGEEGVTVYSVDDDPVWLSHTQEFLHKHKLSIEHTIIWEGFRLQEPGGFDLILHDLGSMALREETLPFVLTLLRPGGFCLINDMHDKEYSPKVKRIIKEAQAQMYTLSRYTRDKYRRYCYLAVRPGKQAVYSGP